MIMTTLTHSAPFSFKRISRWRKSSLVLFCLINSLMLCQGWRHHSPHSLSLKVKVWDKFPFMRLENKSKLKKTFSSRGLKVKGKSKTQRELEHKSSLFLFCLIDCLISNETCHRWPSWCCWSTFPFIGRALATPPKEFETLVSCCRIKDLRFETPTNSKNSKEKDI